jgi:RNA polymerase sigma-70 factor (ECF subfamily)
VDDLAHIQEVYAASYRRLVGQLVGVVGSTAEAEDVLMEAFARAVQRRRSFSEADNPEAWLRKVAVNVARSRWRRLVRFHALAPLLADDRRYTDLPEDRLALLAAVRQLPRGQRMAIALHYFADLPVSEIAATLGVPAGTVKARLSRGRAALAVLLGDSPATTRTVEDYRA